MPDEPGPEATDEFNVKPLCVLNLTKEVAEALFKVLNMHPIKAGEVAKLVGDKDDNLQMIVMPDGVTAHGFTTHWLD